MIYVRSLAFISLFLGLPAGTALADGGFLWLNGAGIPEPEQKAIIYWKDGVEKLVLQVKFADAPEDFAWVVPLPSKPEIEAIGQDMDPFNEIYSYAQHRRSMGKDPDTIGGFQDEEVTVLDRDTVGVFNVSVLSSSEAGALSKWLNRNGFSFPGEKKDVLEHYVRKNWFFVAMRIDKKFLENVSKIKRRFGKLDPIRFTFESPEMIYPLKISSINSGPTNLELFLLSDEPFVQNGTGEGNKFTIERNVPNSCEIMECFRNGQWLIDPMYGTYHKIDGRTLPLTWSVLGLQEDISLSMCRYRATYEQPEQMHDDLRFVPFDPVSYWTKRRISEIPYYQKRFVPVLVLSMHDGSLLNHCRFKATIYTGYGEDFFRTAGRDLLHNWQYTLLMAMHPKADERLLHELSMHVDADVRGLVAANPRTSEETFLGLLESTVRTRERLLMQDALLSNTRHVGRHACSDLLDEFVHCEDLELRAGFATNGKAPPDLLRKLSNDPEIKVRIGVAENAMTPLDVLQRLAGDKNEWIRMEVARNGGVEPEILELLKDDKSPSVRSEVASNDQCTQQILQELAGDERSDVRLRVVQNQKTSVEILRILEKDGDSNVSRTAEAVLKQK